MKKYEDSLKKAVEYCQQYVNKRDIFFLIVLICFSFGIVHLIPKSFDVYYMAALGEKIVETKSIPFENSLSVLTGAKIVIQQPLFCVLCYFSQKYFQIIEPIYIFGTNLAIVIFLYYLAKRKNSSPYKAFVMVSIVVPMIALFQTMRPMAITFILLTIEIIVLTKYKEDKNIKVLFALPVVSCLQTNIHAALLPYFFIFALPYLFPNVFIKNRKIFVKELKSSFPIILILLLSFGTSFLNCTQMDAVTWFSNVSVCAFKNNISELHSVYESSFIFKIFFAFGLILFIKICVDVYKKRNTIPVLLLNGGLLIMSFFFIRNIYFLPIGLVQSIFPFPFKKKNINFILSYSTMLIIIGIVFLLSPKCETPICSSPYKAVIYLNENNPDAKIMTEPDSGSYFNAYGYKTDVNSMPESGFKQMNGIVDIYIENGKAFSDASFTGLYLSKYDINAVLMCTDPNCQYYSVMSGARNYLHLNKEWKEINFCKEYSLYIKR